MNHHRCSSHSGTGGKTLELLAMLLAILVIGQASVATAQEVVAGSLPVRHWADRIKNPVEWFSWGADLRLRNDTSDNPSLSTADPPGHSFSFERLRLRQWSTFTPGTGVEVYVRFAWEGRHYWMPHSKEEWDTSEIVFDNLNGRFTFSEIPVTLVVGRQDIVFGEGWLVSDGTPLDGPRTTYFDALRATIDLKELTSVLDLIYIDQTASPNRRLAPIFSRGKALMEQDERGSIVYFGNRAMDSMPIDAYFIYKHDEAVLPSGDTGDVFTIGGSVARVANGAVSGRVEGAYQFGTRRNATMFHNRDGALSAWGLNSRLTWSFRDPSRNQVWLGYEVLSGNDADSHNRQFDPLWGRWAKYSELFPNDLDRPSDRSNLHRINAGHQFEPVNGMPIQTNYHALFAYANRNSGTPGFSENGSFKGHLFTALLRYQYDRFWSGYLLGEYFVPGNYYDAPSGGGPLRTRDDPATFLRAQIVYTF